MIAIAQGFLNALILMGTVLLSLVIYAGLIWLMTKLFEFIAYILYYPIIRLLTRGSISSRQKPIKLPPPVP